MRIFKVTGNVIAKVFGTIEDVADVVSVTAKKLKPIVENTLEVGVVTSNTMLITTQIDAEAEILEARESAKRKPGRPKK
jgi:hypothetical protein